MPIPIITTKLFIPPPRPELVSRARLLEKFLAGLHGKLTLLSAPAGFGKSTLLSECVAGSGRAIAWLSLDSGDSDLTRFLTYLLAAIARVQPGFAETSTLLLQAQQLPPTEELLVCVLNELAVLEQEMVIVLDDYHLLDCAEVDQALIFLVEHLPPQLHVMLSTREDPQFPLAAWRVKGWFNEFRASDLRFTAEEACSFFSQTMALQLPESVVLALEKRTEGWVAGLQLAALSLQGRQDPQEFVEAFTGSHRFVLDYLVGEVLQQLSESDRSFMLQTSVLHRLHASLCDAVTLQSGSKERLAAFDHSNLFLIPLDDKRQWFRYHHLFRDVLRARLLEQGGDVVSELHSRASGWFAANTYPIEAIQHSLEAGNRANSTALIEREWPSLRASMPEPTLLSWLAGLPDSEIKRRPVLCAHYGFCLLSSDIDRADEFLQEAERWLAEPKLIETASDLSVESVQEMSELPGMLAIGRAYQAGARGDLPGIVTHAEKALEFLDEKETVFRGAAAVLLGTVYWSQGELSRAYTSIEKGHQSMHAAGDVSAIISTLNLLALLRVAQGRLREAIALCEIGVTNLREHQGVAPQGAADIYVTLAAVKVEQHQLSEADGFLQQAQSLGPQAQLLESRHLWHVVKARVACGHADYSAALSALNEAERVYIPSPAPNSISLATWRARVHLAFGNIEAVEQWQLENELGDSSELYYLREFDHVLVARLLLAQHRRDGDEELLHRCEALLQRLSEAAKKAGRVTRLVECRVLMALCFNERAQRDKSIKALAEAVELAQSEGYRAVFLEGQVLEELLRELAPCHEYAAQLVGDNSAEPMTHGPVAKISSGLAEPLSERELDVLRRLDSELSGPEIANTLFISLNTLRTHSKNIYAKLGVNSRRAAVKRAAELGLR